MLTTLVVTLLLAPRHSDKVTFASRPAPLPKLLSELSRTCGVNLTCSGELRDEVMVVRVKDVDLEDLLARIAATQDAEWRIERDKARVLKRSDALVKQRAKREAQELVDGYRVQIAKMQKDAKAAAIPVDAFARIILQMGSDSPERARGERTGTDKIWAALPSSKALAAMLSTAPLETWAALPAGRTVVYATNPNRLQLPMPSEWTAIVKEAIAEQNQLAAKIGKEADLQELTPLRTIEPGAKALLEVSASGDGTITLGLRIKDSAGGAAPGYIHLYLYPAASTAPTQLKPPAELAQTPVPFSPEAEELLVSKEKAQSGQETSQALKDRLSNPEKNEPLAFSFAEGVFDIGEIWDLDIVSPIPDELFMPSKPLQGDRSLRWFLESLPAGTLKLTASDGWLIGEIGSVRQRLNRADRAILGKWGRAAAAHRTPTIAEQLAEATNPRVAEARLFPIVWNLLWPGSPIWFDSLASNRTFALLGTEVQNAVISGQEVLIANLSPQAQAALADQVYYGELRRLQIVDPNPRHDEVYPDGSRAKMLLFAHQIFDSEPTEMMANGLPKNAVLATTIQKDQLGEERSLQLESWACFKAKPSDPFYWRRSARRIAFMLAGRDSVPIEGLEEKQFGFGRMLTGQFSVQLLPNVSIRLAVGLSEVDLSQPVALSAAPDYFKAELNKWLEAYGVKPPTSPTARGR